MNIEKYGEHIKTLFDSDSDIIFSNGKTEHAMLILSEFLKRAKESVSILCYELKDSVYSDKQITAPLKDALQRGVKVRIIVQNDYESKAFIQAAKMYNSDPSVEGLVEVFECHEHDYKNVEQNVAIMDEKAFRYERNRQKHEAEATANQPQHAIPLQKTFDEMWHELLLVGRQNIAA